MATVLAILGDGFEEIETLAPIDLLRRAGAALTTASLNADIHVTGRSNVVIHADTVLGKVTGPEDFDCLLIPGGPGVKALRADARVQALVRAYAAKDKWIAAICAAPLLLKDAGLLQGRQYTAFPGTIGELPEMQSSMKVVRDGRLITSRGAGTSLEFGLAIIEHLMGPSKAAEIGASICM